MKGFFGSTTVRSRGGGHGGLKIIYSVEEPWRPLLEARGCGDRGGTHLKYAVSAVFRDSRRDYGEGGSGHVLVDCLPSVGGPAGKPSVGPRESGVVSTGRSSVKACYSAGPADTSGRARVES